MFKLSIRPYLPGAKQNLIKLIYSKRFVYTIWFGVGLFIVLRGLVSHQPPNNYLIFKHNFLNVIHQQSLYTPQPEYYYDRNHYGPVFSLIIAPFALLPDGAGVVLWVLFNAFVLFKAIQLLPLKNNSYIIILLLCANEIIASSIFFQFNPIITALIILSFYFIRKKQDFWAALMIALGTFTKLYGIVGLAFFFFSDNKLKLIASLVFWSVVLFVLPMAISSPNFILKTYSAWYHDLLAKNTENVSSDMQDISVMGIIRRVFNPGFKNIYVIAPATFVFALSYIRVKYFKSTQYQLLILASVLIFTVIFSSSAESPTYIIAFSGVAIWFMNLNRPVTILEICLLVFAIVITSFPFADVFIKNFSATYIRPYKLKALPCLLVWLYIIYETLTRKFPSEQKLESAE
ncbi:MAG: glycosyltransferase family 87 protein [Bacteroidota bacterium]